MGIAEALQTAAITVEEANAKAPSKPVEVPGDIVGFLHQVREANVRITYHCLAALLVEEGCFKHVEKKGIDAMNAIPYVKQLPEDLQALVCNAKGKYKGERWESETPFINDAEQVLALYQRSAVQL
jgi:hypothetical protein